MKTWMMLIAKTRSQGKKNDNQIVEISLLKAVSFSTFHANNNCCYLLRAYYMPEYALGAFISILIYNVFHAL